MSTHNFIWCDLSTFDLEKAKTFYTRVFDWEYDAGNHDYHTAYADQQEVSGLYLMPDTFVNMNMPSFWMSYVQVENVADTIEKAKALGGTVELTEEDPLFGKIALLRDPSGAGFTVFEDSQQYDATTATAGTMYWNELYISDPALVMDFYTGLFDWDIREKSNGRYDVHDKAGEHITSIQQVSNSEKGEHEYWGVYFAVDNLQQTRDRITEQGGDIHYEDTYGVVASDPLGAVFHCTEAC